jgi:hypothetical protein
MAIECRVEPLDEPAVALAVLAAEARPVAELLLHPGERRCREPQCEYRPDEGKRAPPPTGPDDVGSGDPSSPLS